MSLHLGNTIAGATGLLRVSEAGAGASGTFRMSLMGSYFSGSGFLCGSGTPCPSLNGEPQAQSDDVTRVAVHLGLSATVLPFLEMYGSFHNHATSDSRGRPQLLQVLGDTTFGLKGFMPMSPDQIFFVGGAAELYLLNGTGGVGLDGGSTSFAIRALATADLNNRLNAADRIPLRFHLNVGYKFDNSANIVKSVEQNPPPLGRNQNITRIERFGLDINRVDFLQLGLGGEFVHEYVRPFAEWTMDLPFNRQSYVCKAEGALANGEGCLGENQGFATSPSRLTIGARVFPWPDHGLSLLTAFDIGTSGTSKFVDEIVPEMPWNFWLGIGYGVDTVPPKPVIQRVEAPPAPPPPPAAPTEYFVQGVVVEKNTTNPIPDAVIKFDGRSMTGMVAREDGTFRSAPLDPGTYTFNVSASGYRDGQCSATVQPVAPGQPGVVQAGVGGPPGTVAPPVVAGAPPAAQPGMPAQPGVPAQPGMPAQPGPVDPNQPPGAQPSNVFSVQCELEALPKVGTVVGSLVDADGAGPVGGGSVKVTDKLNRELNLTADANGAFRFENVPPGPLKFTVDVPGYFTNVSEVTVRPHEESQARILLNKRPAQPNVVVAGREIKLKKQVHFQTDSADILPDSMGILEELADVMSKHPDIKEVEVQGHTDNTGNEAYNLRLSQARAQAVVDAIAKLGVDPSRMSAKGYGQSKPLVPNTTDANKAKNRRVQVMITQK
jgi:outer membrane protein OmpA-like peptidoglycan-associated protein